MKYKCLVLDHDDTVVKSTPTIHYPSFKEAMSELRPALQPYTLEEFVGFCFDPGFQSLCDDILQFSEIEKERQQVIWKSYTKKVIPQFYEGFSDLIKLFKSLGGSICVVSHSERETIIRDYQETLGIVPDLVFGWELKEDLRKPNAHSLNEIMKQFHLKNSEILVVDDLKPGLVMARSCDVDFACAGWSHLIPSIQEYMQLHSDYYFKNINDLSKFIFE